MFAAKRRGKGRYGPTVTEGAGAHRLDSRAARPACPVRPVRRPRRPRPRRLPGRPPGRGPPRSARDALALAEAAGDVVTARYLRHIDCLTIEDQSRWPQLHAAAERFLDGLEPDAGAGLARQGPRPPLALAAAARAHDRGAGTARRGLRPRRRPAAAGARGACTTAVPPARRSPSRCSARCCSSPRCGSSRCRCRCPASARTGRRWTACCSATCTRCGGCSSGSSGATPRPTGTTSVCASRGVWSAGPRPGRRRRGRRRGRRGVRPVRACSVSARSRVDDRALRDWALDPLGAARAAAGAARARLGRHAAGRPRDRPRAAEWRRRRRRALG